LLNKLPEPLYLKILLAKPGWALHWLLTSTHAHLLFCSVCPSNRKVHGLAGSRETVNAATEMVS
jgi:hypothetical protein